jgi:hypothetical protein
MNLTNVEKVNQHIEWFQEKIASNTYQTYDDEDEIMQLILAAELKHRGIDIDLKTIVMIDRLKRSICQHTGTLWQRILGTAPGWSDLGIGDTSGCDLINEDRKQVIELKNKWNTMNSGSKESVCKKLEAQKRKGYDAYIGIVNPHRARSNTRTLKNGVKQVTGAELFKVIYGCDVRREIIHHIKETYEHKLKKEDTTSLEDTLSQLSIRVEN